MDEFIELDEFILYNWEPTVFGVFGVVLSCFAQKAVVTCFLWLEEKTLLLVPLGKL
jgi:hypothetical protein